MTAIPTVLTKVNAQDGFRELNRLGAASTDIALSQAALKGTSGQMPGIIWRSASGSIVDEEKRIVHAVINTSARDSYDTIVRPRGVRLDRFKKNPQVLWNHDLNWPIGRGLVDTIKVTDDRIELDYKFYDFSDVPHRGPLAGLVEDLWHLVKNSDLIGYSVGFMPHDVSHDEETGVLVYTDWELFEFSLTPVPANPETLASAPREAVRRYIQSLARTQDPVKFYSFIEALPAQLKQRNDIIRKAKQLSFDVLQYREVEQFLQSLREREPGFEIQTLIFDKEKFSLRAAAKWCEEHGFKNDKVDETENTYRFRQFDPELCQVGSFRTFDITEGVQAVGCIVRTEEAATGAADADEGKTMTTIFTDNDFVPYSNLYIPWNITVKANVQPESTEARADDVRVNGVGVEHAKQLIAAGKVDRESDWSFDADDGNALLGPNGDDWENYAKWFLATRSGTDPKTKEHYLFPYGKNGKVYRRGVIAAKQRAAQYGYDNVAAAADALLQAIDKDAEEKQPEQYQQVLASVMQLLAEVRDALQELRHAVQAQTEKIASHPVQAPCPKCHDAQEKVKQLEALLAAEKEQATLLAQALHVLYKNRKQS